MTGDPNPDKTSIETVASIIHVISFMSAKGDPPHQGVHVAYALAKG